MHLLYFYQHGGMLVGKIAKERSVSHHEHTFSVFKRSMGTTKKYQHLANEYSSIDLPSFVLDRLKLVLSLS